MALQDKPPTVYDIKRGHWKNIEGGLLPGLMDELFDAVKEDDGAYVASYHAIKELRVQVVDKGTMHIWTNMDPTVDQEAQMKTIKAWNGFLERATGFNAKQRSKRAQEKIKKAEQES